MHDNGSGDNSSDDPNDRRRRAIREGALRAFQSVAARSLSPDIAESELQAELIELIRSSRIGRQGNDP